MRDDKTKELLIRLCERITRLERKIDVLEHSFSNQYIRKAQLFDELKSLPNDVGMYIDRVVPRLLDNGEIILSVKYKIPDKEIRALENGEISYEKGISAINELNFVGVSDIGKISEAVEKFLKK